jgi:signal transduction histidine kinase
MAPPATACGIRILGFAAALLSMSAAGQTPLTLEQAAERKPNTLAPAHEGERVTVTGRVSTAPVQVLANVMVAIQDASLHGLFLQGTAASLKGVRPGDLLEVAGVITQRSGLPVLVPSKVTVTGHLRPPEPQPVNFGDLNSFRYLGLLVVTDAPVIDQGENAGGDLLIMGDIARPLRVFLPHGGPRLPRFSPGDRVRVTGLSSQYCPIPPYNRLFQILAVDAGAAVLLERRSPISPYLLIAVILATAVGLMFLWQRGRRTSALRHMVQVLHRLGEEIIAANTAGDVAKKVCSVLPQVLRVKGARLYIFNRGSKTLDRVASPEAPQPLSIPVDSPAGTLAVAAAACFRNRTLLSIPDTRRSPFFKGGRDPDLPRAVMFVPLFAQNELLGILEIDSGGVYNFSPDQQSAAQHLGNQIATALKLMEQQSIREQLFRSEKLAAAGQLISGVANELRAPLESVSTLAKRVLARHKEPSLESELRAIWLEAQGASETVSRLVAVTRPEQAQAKPVDLNALLRSLMEFREREWRAQGLEVRELLSPDAIWVIGSLGQLEQVFLNLLVHAEQSLTEAPEKSATLRTSVLSRRAVVEISYSSTDPELPFQDPFQSREGAEEGGLGLEVCRGIIQSHGGEIRLTRTPGQGCRFDVELPVAPAPPAGSESRPEARKSSSLLTALLIEPEKLTQERLLAQLSARGYRVIPVGSAEEASDFVQRLHFDLVLCSVRLPGLNWVELFTKIRHQVGGFTLLTEGYDADLSRVFQPGEGYILAKPVQEPELDRLLALLESRLENAGVEKG